MKYGLNDRDRKDTLVSVKTSGDIPKEKIFEILMEIDKISTKAPCHIGDVVIKNVLNLGVNIIITKDLD